MGVVKTDLFMNLKFQKHIPAFIKIRYTKHLCNIKV